MKELHGYELEHIIGDSEEPSDNSEVRQFVILTPIFVQSN
jgi:hypothetical protein